MEYRRTFTIGAREAADFYTYQAVRSRLLGSLGFGVVGLLVCYLYGAGRIQPAYMLWTAMGLSFLAVVAAIAIAYYVAIRKKVKSAIALRGRDTFEQTVLINGFGVRVTAGGREARVGFDKLHAVRETGKAFYLYLTPDEAWFLPKAQMADPEKESAQIRQIFDAVIESSRLHVKK